MMLARQAAGTFVLLALLPSLPWAGPSGGDDLLYDALARRWLERNGETASRDGWAACLERRFAHLAVGLFDVYVPPAGLGDGEALANAAAALQALLDAQAGWRSWVEGSTPERIGKKRKDEPVSRWLAAWRPRAFAQGKGAGADLVELGAAPEEVRASLAHLRHEARSGKSLGVERELAGVRLVLFPRRSEFVEFVCVVGVCDAHLQPTAWNEGLATWLEYRAGDARFLTLEYGGDLGSERGAAVNARNPAALGELVAQASTRALLSGAYGERLDPALASAVANALVIDLYGELDTRIDGDVRSRSSEGSSVFVPGGNPDGGVLPATSAENRWRGTKGKDHFLGVLAQVQKQSGKKAATRPEKLSGFELCSDDGRQKALVRAPFLGAAAKKPAAALFPDYLELLRCYGVAFLHWLRVSGAGEPTRSAAQFGAFLRSLGRNGIRAEDLPRVFADVYGRPLSAAGADELFDQPTLEGQFLAWLATQG